ncbi:hypothetical protein D3C87_1069080 [compost metagenome]
MLDRHFDVLKRHFVRGPRANHWDLPALHALGLARDDETRDAPTLPLFARAGEHQPPVGGSGAGDPHLGSVEHVVIALAHRPRPYRARRIRTTRRLADCDKGLASVSNGGHGEFLDLFGSSEQNGRWRIGTGCPARRHVGPHAATCRFFCDDRGRKQTQATAAILLGRADGPESHLLGLFLQRLQQRWWQAVGIVRNFFFRRSHLIAHESTGRIADLQ